MNKYKLKFAIPGYSKGTEVKIKEHNSSEYRVFAEGNDNYLFTIYHKDLDKWLLEKPKSIYDLEIGDTYYAIDNFKGKEWNLTNNIQLEIYHKKLEMGNVFLTKEDAKKELKKRKAIAKIHKYCHDNGIDKEYYPDSNDVVFLYHNGAVKMNLSDQNGNIIGYFEEYDAGILLENFEEELKLILSQ